MLRPGGRFVFSVLHPIRWTLPDDPGPGGLTISSSYFDRTPYVESAADGQPTYVEHHRTRGDWVGDIGAAGFGLTSWSNPNGRPAHRELGRLVAAAGPAHARHGDLRVR